MGKSNKKGYTVNISTLTQVKTQCAYNDRDPEKRCKKTSDDGLTFYDNSGRRYCTEHGPLVRYATRMTDCCKKDTTKKAKLICKKCGCNFTQSSTEYDQITHTWHANCQECRNAAKYLPVDTGEELPQLTFAPKPEQQLRLI